VTVTAWRIYKPAHAATAFTGEGARRFGGRLNSKGVAVVYTASSISLASLEMLVHLQAADVLAAYVVRNVTFDRALVKTLGVKDLPRNWRDSPPPPQMQQIGDDWTASMTSAVLEVPSVITETESNFLLNPGHPDFKHIKLGVERTYRFDPRLLKT
jgi:RES domain-containing protein